MKFQIVHKLLSYLLAAAAILTLVSSGEVPLPTIGLLLVLGVASWFVEPGTRLGILLDRWGLVFNIAALGFFAISLFQVIKSFPEPDLSPVLNLVLFLLAYKLFHRRSNRDYLQVYILSFLLILASAWLAQSVLFVVGFCVYVLLCTWTLILFHLRREIEDNYLVKHRLGGGAEKITATRVLNSRRVVGGTFFLATGGVAAIILVGATLVFVAVPRIGLGFLSGGVRRRMAIVGFSDEVTLGHHGILSMDNQTVVLRAKMPRIGRMTDASRDQALAGLYWRGTVYDSYQSGQWQRSRRKSDRTLLVRRDDAQGNRTYFVSSPEAPEPGQFWRVPLADTDEQEIQVVGLQHPVAFALDQPVAFKMPPVETGSWTRADAVARFSGEVNLTITKVLPSGREIGATSEFTGAHYFAYSRDPLARPNPRAGRPTQDIPGENFDHYLQTPPSLTPRVHELARSLAGNHTSAAAKAQAIIEWLHRTHGYTMELQRDTSIADPVEDFLFQQKAGHCEYFASASALLLRLAGVPTRYVNGFLGGEWNDLAHHITVRDNRAHSWVEAYMGSFGWVRVDATPAGPAPPRMSRLYQIFDSLELAWSQWVIDYNASRQIEIARKLSKTLGLGARGAKGKSSSWVRPDPRWVAGGILVAVAAYLAWRLGRRTSWNWMRFFPGGNARRGAEAPIVRAYRHTLDRLANRGWTRAPSETPREFSRRLAQSGVPGCGTIDRLSEHYAAYCYGGHDVPPGVLEDLRGLLDQESRATYANLS